MEFWKMPIVIARHTHADIYDVVDMRTTRPGHLDLKFEPSDGSIGWGRRVH